MNTQEMAARLEIQELLARYCHTLDAREWDQFAGLFTKDAEVDYSQFEGPRGGVAVLVPFLQTVMSAMESTLHAISTISIQLRGDVADVRCCAHVTLVPKVAQGDGLITNVGLWYQDEVVKEGERWLIRKRTQQKSYIVTSNME